MELTNRDSDSPIDWRLGLSGRRERLWGFIGGTLGSLMGIGSFLIAWLIQNEPWEEMARSPYPMFHLRSPSGWIRIDPL